MPTPLELPDVDAFGWYRSPRLASKDSNDYCLSMRDYNSLMVGGYIICDMLLSEKLSLHAGKESYTIHTTFRASDRHRHFLILFNRVTRRSDDRD